MIDIFKNTWRNNWRAPGVSEGLNWLLNVAGTSSSGARPNPETALLRFIVVVLIILTIVMVTTRTRRRRPRIPNFMVWVGGGHRRERTELGLAGVYLDRRPLPPTAVPAASSYSGRPQLRRVRSCSALLPDKRTASPSSLTPHSIAMPTFPMRNVHCAYSAPLISTPALAAAAHVRERATPSARSESPTQYMRYSRTI